MKFKFLIFILFLLIIISLSLSSLTKSIVYVLNFENKNFSIKLQHQFPKICEKRVWEINLTKNLIYFYENCRLKEKIPIAYQAPPGVWYQTPTGYYRIGIKKEKHISSLFPVYMNYAVQFYEDFFIHEIPYYFDGQRVENNFTGGCLRLETKNAKKFYEMAKTGDLVISYLDLDDIEVKENFVFPVNKNEFYIRQRFNNPLRVAWNNLKNRKIDYLQHAGVDLAPNPKAKDLNVYNIYKGKVVKITKNGIEDHGLGNTVIVEHLINGEKIYSLYGHLKRINPEIKEGDFVKAGEILGEVGATGYGCDYWKIGEDGCDKLGKLDVHLHFEIKKAPLLESPEPAICNINGISRSCYGYTPDNPTKYGYYDPIKFIVK